MEIRDCVAVVTGGGSGLGKATARMVVENGGKAAILDLSEENGSSVANELGSNAIFIRTDITSEQEVSAALEQTIARFGDIRIVVNCAGIVVSKKILGKKGVHDLESFLRVLHVNIAGTFNVLRLASDKMKDNLPNADQERGVIINTASVAAFDGQIGQAAYSASKGAVASMTLPIARELAVHGIRVMAIAPGLFETPMFDSLPEENRRALSAMVPFPVRLGRPDEFALLVKSITENAMLNGEVIRLDGAIRMQPK